MNTRQVNKETLPSTTTTTATMQNRPKNLSSSFRRLFRWSSSRSGSTKVQQAECTPPSPLSHSPSTMNRSKSNKEITSHRGFDDFSIKSATLPSPIRPPPPSPHPSSPSKRHPFLQPHSSPTRRQHTHTPITIGNSISPPVHRTLPRQLPPLRQAVSNWDIYPTTCHGGHHCDLIEKQRCRQDWTGTLTSVVAPTNHTYSEPYHWLYPAPVHCRGDTLPLTPPPLPPRPHQG